MSSPLRCRSVRGKSEGVLHLEVHSSWWLRWSMLIKEIRGVGSMEVSFQTVSRSWILFLCLSLLSAVVVCRSSPFSPISLHISVSCFSIVVMIKLLFLVHAIIYSCLKVKLARSTVSSLKAFRVFPVASY